MQLRWKILLGAVAAITLWLSGLALMDLWPYWALNAHTEAKVERWEVREQGEQAYLLARYTFEAEGSRYEAEHLFLHPVFLNSFAAAADLPQWEALRWEVWYDGANPHYSALQRDFPWKRIIRALLAIAVLLYFYFLLHLSRATSRQEM